MEALICRPSLSLQLTIATGNPTKVAEIEPMLGPLPIHVQRQPDDLDVEETGSTYREKRWNVRSGHCFAGTLPVKRFGRLS